MNKLLSKILALILLLSLMGVVSVQAQDSKTVSGTIKDKTGDLLAGVGVQIKGKSGVVISDLDGNFEIKASTKDVLTFSYIGYITHEITVGTKTHFDVVLADDHDLLEEIVVVGYGVQRKGSVTGSVSTVDAKELLKAPVADVTNSIAGRLPGLRSVTRSGEPGSSGSEIDVRGFGSALIIIDGIPGSFSQIDANEIESVSVLKDASAAVYGVKAANGVILVTTKRGKSGVTRINVNSSMSWQKPTKYPSMATGAEYVELVDEDAVNQAIYKGVAIKPVYGRDELEKWKNAADKDHQNTDWADLIMRDLTPQQQHNLNISGGKDSLRYFASIGYLNQQGIWKSGDSKFNRFNFRTNVDAKLVGGLSTAISVAGRQENRDSPYDGPGIIMSSIIRNQPTIGPYANGNPNYLGVTSQPHQNPLVITNKDISGYRKRTNNVFDGSLALNYDMPFVEGLSAKAQYSYRVNSQRSKSFRKKYNLYKYDKEKDIYTDDGYVGNDPSTLTEASGNYTNSMFQGSLNYSNKFKKHSISGLLLFETREYNTDDFDASREFVIDVNDYLNSGESLNKNNSGSAYEESNVGYVGRVNYNYDKRYLFEFSFRYDGSSRFHKDNRWGFFPAVSGGWRMSEEPFMKNSKSTLARIISDFKIRGSWGRLGDDSSAPGFEFVGGYLYPNGNYILDGNILNGLVSKGIVNKQITWFTSDLTNVGFELSLWSGLLSAEFDYFYRKRSGLLKNRALSLPGTFGASLPQENLEGDSDRGFELVLRHKNTLNNGLFYSITGNVSKTKSRWEYKEQSLPNNQMDNWKNKETNRWKNRWVGYKSIGQFQSYEEIASAPVQDGEGNKSLRPGDIRYLDYNKDGIIDDNDTHVIGRGDKPEIMFGLDLYVEWKGFDLTMFFQGAANFNANFDGEIQNPLFNGANSLGVFMDRWHREDIYDPNSPWVPGKYPSTHAGGLQSNTKPSTFWLQSASYLRMKDLQLGYTLPGKLLKKSGIQKLRLYISAHNLFTITNLEILDPEAPSGRGWYYPQQKIYTIGLNLTL